MDPFLLLQEEDDQDPILNFTLSPPEPLLDSTPILTDSFIIPNQPQFDVQIAPVIWSAFKTYDKTSVMQQPSNTVNSNVHKRLFGFMNTIRGKMTAEVAMREKAHEECANVESMRGFRHMMRERIRRERMSQGYADLHSLLASSSLKGDKYTIVKTAARYLQELKNEKERLQKRHEELQSARKTKMAIDGAIIELRFSSSIFPSVDSLKLVLHCFRLLNLTVLSFRSEFSDSGDLLVTVGVRNQKFAKDELENIVMNRLVETEKEICALFSLQNKWFLSCRVENGENS